MTEAKVGLMWLLARKVEEGAAPTPSSVAA